MTAPHIERALRLGKADRSYMLRCRACGSEKRHQGRPPRLCSKCGADREAVKPEPEEACPE